MAKAYVHESSIVDEGVVIGEGAKVWHFCHLMSGARVGKNCVLGQNVFVGEGVVIGNDVRIQNNVSVYEGVEIGDKVFCGPSVVFTNVKTPRAEFSVHKKYDKTKICDGVSLGANAVVVCGVKIGEYAFVGAGSVVTKDVPNYTMVYGNPARIRGNVCRCANKLILNEQGGSCRNCGLRFGRDKKGQIEVLS